jgi:hypothetical protein
MISKIITCSIIGAIALLIFCILVFHYAPFYLTSYTVWVGIIISVIGLVSVIIPLRIIFINNRLTGLIILCAGIILFCVSLFLPESVKKSNREHQRLDDFLYEFQSSEYHETLVRAPLERVIDASKNVSFYDMAPVKILFRIRTLASKNYAEPYFPKGEPVLDMMTKPGSAFLPLDISNPRELVFGMTGKPWSNQHTKAAATPEEFLKFNEPGSIRVAFNIKIVEEKPGLIRLSTETRNLGNDAHGRKVFARYWRVIYPGSAIIRRVWLDAIAAKAEAEK